MIKLLRNQLAKIIEDIDGATYGDLAFKYNLVSPPAKEHTALITEHFRFAPRTGVHCVGMFAQNFNITNIDSFDTSNATRFDYMFCYCENLKSVGLLDMSKATATISMFFGDSALEHLGGLKDFGKGYAEGDASIDLNSCTKLTHESLMNVINTVYDFGKTCTSKDDACGVIILDSGGILLSKLSADEISIANKKGWWLKSK